MASTPIPKGKLLIIGGAEDKGGEERPDIKDKIGDFRHFEILKELVPKNSQSGYKIEIITMASEVPDEVKARYDQAFEEIGYKHVDFIDLRDKIEARENTYVKRFEEAGALFFTGGDQLRISTILGGTELCEIMHERFLKDSKFIVAGTSAGAMAMSRIMIAGGGVNEALLDHDLRTASGLGLLESCIIDTHFIKRGRFGRLAHAVIINPGQLGVGLGEDTALIIKNGCEAECRGSGMVVIIDGGEIGQTNVADAGERDPVFVENLKIHLLVRGCTYNLKTKELSGPLHPSEIPEMR